MFLCEGERLEDAVGDFAEVDRVAAVLTASVGLGHVGDHGLERNLCFRKNPPGHRTKLIQNVEIPTPTMIYLTFEK